MHPGQLGLPVPPWVCTTSTDTWLPLAKKQQVLC